MWRRVKNERKLWAMVRPVMFTHWITATKKQIAMLQYVYGSDTMDASLKEIPEIGNPFIYLCTQTRPTESWLVTLATQPIYSSFPNLNAQLCAEEVAAAICEKSTLETIIWYSRHATTFCSREQLNVALAIVVRRGDTEIFTRVLALFAKKTDQNYRMAHVGRLLRLLCQSPNLVIAKHLLRVIYNDFKESPLEEESLPSLRRKVLKEVVSSVSDATINETTLGTLDFLVQTFKLSGIDLTLEEYIRSMPMRAPATHWYAKTFDMYETSRIANKLACVELYSHYAVNEYASKMPVKLVIKLNAEHIASCLVNGHVAAAAHILESESPEISSSEAFLTACMYEEHKIAKTILERTPLPWNNAIKTAFATACLLGNLSTVKWLDRLFCCASRCALLCKHSWELECKEDRNVYKFVSSHHRDAIGHAPLFWLTCLNNRLEVVKWLVKRCNIIQSDLFPQGPYICKNHSSSFNISVRADHYQRKSPGILDISGSDENSNAKNSENYAEDGEEGDAENDESDGDEDDEDENISGFEDDAEPQQDCTDDAKLSDIPDCMDNPSLLRCDEYYSVDKNRINYIVDTCTANAKEVLLWLVANFNISNYHLPKGKDALKRLFHRGLGCIRVLLEILNIQPEAMIVVDHQPFVDLIFILMSSSTELCTTDADTLEWVLRHIAIGAKYWHPLKFSNRGFEYPEKTNINLLRALSRTLSVESMQRLFGYNRSLKMFILRFVYNGVCARTVECEPDDGEWLADWLI